MPVTGEHERLWVQRPHREAPEACEDRPSRLRGSRAPLLGVVGDGMEKRDHARPTCLGRSGSLAGPSTPDHRQAPLQVKILPPEPANLAGPHP